LLTVSPSLHRSTVFQVQTAILPRILL